MPISSSGRIVKTLKGKRGTPHHKNHRWESFTVKIAKLSSLNPIRRIRRHDLDSEDLSATTSYFRNGLEKWRETNISGRFVEFVREVAPLSDSLPQILHFEDKIMDLLVAHLEMKELVSIEPLLDLLTGFARDLGVRFEKYYERALKLVMLIAGTSQEVEIIEWSFGCLAFMFKYLSKLLASDLRPTYDLMAPLLGKEGKKPHIARFAAEAMSFLVRKAAAPAVRGNALDTFVLHCMVDLISVSESRQYGLYRHGLMTMFSEAMKGNGLSIHSSGKIILQCLFRNFCGNDIKVGQESPREDLILGVLTSLVHHSSSETLKDVVAAVLEEASDAINKYKNAQDAQSFHHLMLSARSIGTLAGVRKGSRISNWPPLLRSLVDILRTLSSSKACLSDVGGDDKLWTSVIFSTSVVLQYSPMDALIPFVSDLMKALTTDPLSKWFLVFCYYYAGLNVEQFKSLILPYFQRFVTAHWSEANNEDSLCIILPKLTSSCALISNGKVKEKLALPQSWQDQIVSKFERLEVSPFPEQSSILAHGKSPQIWHERCLPKYRALLEVLECTSVHPSTNARIAEIILRKLKLALRPSSALGSNEANFIVGYGFKEYSRIMKDTGEVNNSLGPLLRAAAPRYSRLPSFLDAMITYETALESYSNSNDKNSHDSIGLCKWPQGDGDSDLLIHSLVNNLCTDLHDLRLLSLRLLDNVFQRCLGNSSEVLSTMLLIEQMPLDLQNSRSISMHIRHLAALYKGNETNPVYSRAIPYFFFGMLRVKLAQAATDAIAALAQVAETSIGEDIIAELAFRWLETPSLIWQGSAKGADKARDGGLTDFECSNVIRLDGLAEAAKLQISTAQNLMLLKFETEQRPVPVTPATARTEALRVLAAVPRIAERRSRQFVPMFLSWADRDEELEEISVVDGAGGTASKSNWTRRDQRSQLDIIALFANSRVLYKSEDVYAALLFLLINGDLDTQKSALKAILTWKSANIKPYEENLFNLLDEARFKDEITLLLQGQTLIQSQHRAELMPVLLRLLYGRSVARKGTASGRQGMEARRLTVIRSLGLQDVGDFLDIALGGLKHLSLASYSKNLDALFDKEILDVRRQHGLLNMVEDIIKELGSNVGQYTERLLSASLYCLIFASRRLQNAHEIDEEETGISQSSTLKTNRQIGYKCLVLLFLNNPKFDWSPSAPTILNELIIPRIEKLPAETTQGVSGLLQLLSTWASSSRTVLFLGEDSRIITGIAECIVQSKSKDQVKLFALSIVKHIIKHAHSAAGESESSSSLVRSRLLDPNIEKLLSNIGTVLRCHDDPSKELLEACVETITELTPFVSSSDQTYNLIDVSVFLLDQPTRRVNPKTKNGLLQILERFVPLYELQADPVLTERIYGTITSQFGFFRDRSSREILSRVLQVYSQTDENSIITADLCAGLNSFSENKLDEPDYDRRLRAYTSIIKSGKGFTARQWRPLLYNMLFYIRHDEEFGILSSNSSDGICNFLDCAYEALEDTEEAQFQLLLSSILVPALYSGVREESEFLRREYVKVMAHLIRTFPSRPDVSDMHVLLSGDDELEDSFFNNILSAGKGIQSKALGQLAAVASQPVLTSRSVGQFLIPLIEHFIFNRTEGSDGHQLAAEATSTLGVLAGSLDWGQYRSMMRRFIGYITSKPDLEKQIIKLLGRVIDALAEAADAKARFMQDSTNASSDEGQLTVPGAQAYNEPLSKLAITLPVETKLTEDLTLNILPPLLTYLHDKDESKVSLRVPVAVIAVRLLKLLPHEKMLERLPAVLTDICHILRSKAQESRDLTRETLSKICVLLGPSYFGFVLKELRGALARGYQVHVLSYTMHSILVATIPEFSPGDLDYCLPSIVAIIMDDIFGAAGQEKDAVEYVSKMKEVKSSKSHDSMELVARTSTLRHLTDLVRPIVVLLKEKLDLRTVRKIDELLNRINNGLLKNPAAQSRDCLVFCYEVIQDAYATNTPQIKKKEDDKLKKYLIQSGASKSGSRGSTTAYTYKLVRFALDIMRSVLKKHDSLRTTGNLTGFIPVLGDALVDAEEEVKIAAFRLLTTIVKVPPTATDKGIDLYRVGAKEAITSILSSSSTTSDISQASLKFISAVLRDRKEIAIKDKSIDSLLERLKDDITIPERRHTTFNFLRSVLSSKVETAIVYDTFDYVGTVMVTNDDKDTRDLARGAYFQFLGEYPQRRKRWSKQLAFIVANLKYEREGGRLSILEVIHLLLSKSSTNFVQEVSATCFVPLILALVNDDSEKCRMAAGELIKVIFEKADNERLETFLKLLRSWIGQQENASVMRLGFLSYGFYYMSRTSKDGDVEDLLSTILGVLRTEQLLEFDWEIIYAALQLLLILCERFPERALAGDEENLWTTVRTLLSYPHAWVKLSSIRLITLLFADFAKASPDGSLGSLPLEGSYGLRVSKDGTTNFIRRLTGMLKTPNLTELLATEIVKNLLFLGRCAVENNLKWADSSEVEGEPSDGEDDTDEQQTQTALSYVLRRISSVLRQEMSPPRASILIPKTAALHLLKLLCSKLPAEALASSLNLILLPLHNLTDPDIPTPYSTDDLFKTGYEALKVNSAEIMSLLQKKCGTRDYTSELLKVREGVKARRTQRSAKRKVEAVAAPEKHGREKLKKVARKKERRKERGLEHRDQRRGW